MMEMSKMAAENRPNEILSCRNMGKKVKNIEQKYVDIDAV